MKKYFLAGTFDHFHVGHQYLCWKALEIIKNNTHNYEFIILIARDKTVQNIKKITPTNNEQKRLKRLEQEFKDFGLGKNIFIRLGRLDANFKKTLIEVNPDIIFLGYDQHFNKNILENFDKIIEIKRIKPYGEKYFKSSKFRK